MTESKELATVTETEIIPIADIKKRQEHLELVKRELLKPNDFQKIGDKQFIKRSGWRTIAAAFNLSDRIVSEKRTDRADGSFVWHIIVEATAPNGRICTGSGACDTKERAAKTPGKSAWAHVEHDVYATAHTRAKNRAISDMMCGGELSAEELEPSESEPASTTTVDDNDSVEYELEQRIEKAGLDTKMVGLEMVGNIIIGRMKGYVGLDLWRQYNDIMLGLGFRWVRDEKDKKNSRWERGE